MSLVDKIDLPRIMYFVSFSSKTSFFRLKDIYPECFFYRDDSPQIEPLVCLREDNACTVGKSCMEVLAKRLYVLFEEVCPQSDMILLYYKKRNFVGIGAGVFDRRFENPRTITMNPSAWELIKGRGIVYQFDPSRDFFLSGSMAPLEEVKNSEDQVLD